ncbi:DUF402 domain-containing protein [Deinococcus radiotolerans]|uniref:DUF402 domain-containing protein n=1 Tax=Deinococcus radiotolerans TaxID=1309407 RepID=A0ABQ2FHF5_9DEIO|nr:DUF402 domain-containing protein [Deinococcus radiotolerans]GGK90764.1 hypothetical protein GCM10010844_06630 [Deinococcus radiotolerans]
MKRKDGRYLQFFPGVQGTQRVLTLPEGWLVDVTFTHVPEPHAVTVHGVTVPTLVVGARWLTLVPTQRYAALLVILYGEAPVFAYADVCAATGLDEDGLPGLDDLYLDVRATLDPEWRPGVPEIIDTDELDAALHSGEITPDQHALAWATAREVEHELVHNTFPLLQAIQAFVSPVS